MDTTVYDTQQGFRLAPLFPSSQSWTTRIGAPGSGTSVFQLADTDMTREQWRELMRPWARTIVQSIDGQPVYAGVIISRSYDKSSKTLTVRHSEVREIFSRRFSFGLNGYAGSSNPADPDYHGALRIVNRSARGTARAIIERGALMGPTGHPWRLPIEVPADEAGDVNVVWENYQVRSIERLLTEVEERHDGPDIYFRPTADPATATLEWEMQIGNPRLSGQFFHWPLDAPEPTPFEVAVEEDAAKQLTGVFMLGTGQGVDQKRGDALITSGLITPILDRVDSASQVGDVDQLNSLAQGQLTAHAIWTTQVSMSVRASSLPDARFLTPGATVRIDTLDDPWMPDDAGLFYVISVSGDLTDTLKLEVQAID